MSRGEASAVREVVPRVGAQLCALVVTLTVLATVILGKWDGL